MREKPGSNANVPEPGENPPLHDLDSNLHLGLISGLGSTRWYDGKAIMLGESRIGAVDLGFIAVRTNHGGLEIVGDDHLGDPTESRKGPHMRANPVRQALGPGRLGVGVVGGPEDSHENRHLVHLPTVAVDHGDTLPSVIHKELLARTVGLPQDEIQLARPGAVALAKPTVLQAIGHGRLIFLPQQKQRVTLAFEFAVDRRPIRHQVRCGGSGRDGRKQQPFESLLIIGDRQGPR